jgi:predicted Rossmann fold flavoprotein
VIALDGAKRIGAKILISGGGRCNVTHDVVRSEDFNGNRNIVAKVLRSFDVPQTIDFFREIGVELKREETGKLFPCTDRARTVLDALLQAAADAGAMVASDRRVGEIRAGSPFGVVTEQQTITAARVILAAGGRSVPKTGSDGSGYTLARALGHSVTPTFPALVPLVLPKDHWLTSLSGTSVDAELALRAGGGGVRHRERGAMLFTHFGLSGPVVLDISRHWVAARGQLTANLLPMHTFDSLDRHLLDMAGSNPQATIISALRAGLPDRLLSAVAKDASRLDAGSPLTRLQRDERRRLVRSLLELPLPVVADRGFDYAEVTAGGVPLSEIDAATMASRRCRGLYVCGEVLDVDGKIGGYNFQWAWAGGRLAGMHAASSLAVP